MLVGTFHLLRQFLGSHLAGGDKGATECLDKVPPTQTGDLRAFPLRNQAAALEVDRRRKTDFAVEVRRTRSEILQQLVRDLDCDRHALLLIVDAGSSSC